MSGDDQDDAVNVDLLKDIRTAYSRALWTPFLGCEERAALWARANCQEG